MFKEPDGEVPPKFDIKTLYDGGVRCQSTGHRAFWGWVPAIGQRADLAKKKPTKRATAKKPSRPGRPRKMVDSRMLGVRVSARDYASLRRDAKRENAAFADHVRALLEYALARHDPKRRIRSYELERLSAEERAAVQSAGEQLSNAPRKDLPEGSEQVDSEARSAKPHGDSFIREASVRVLGQALRSTVGSGDRTLEPDGAVKMWLTRWLSAQIAAADNDVDLVARRLGLTHMQLLKVVSSWASDPSAAEETPD